MTKRIQAYFRTEDEAVGAQTSLIAYNLENSEVSRLTDPLNTSRSQGRNILLPLVPYNNASTGGGIMGASGASGTVANAAFAPGLVIPDAAGHRDLAEDKGPVDDDVKVLNSEEVTDGDLDDLHYVMDLKVPEAQFDEVVRTLRGKHAFVEVFES
ncbi:hypothetical protein [Paenibacillus donghaensis]|uniref:Uncharacterized protein n=1 Tax=Paenibacillus donghaensis TaxID=414771 RepID=A0A2Z2KDF6_9BACL|nr:hypothetical protein [Paenibacillus donghaensis]ASA23697.1 hypothetical protein B9T62_24645 [Paenibacillus donghaensis]